MYKENGKNISDIYNLYFAKIRGFIKARVNNDDFVADDLTSDVFEKVIKNINKFKWQGVPFSAWIYKIANNTLIDYYREEGKKALKFELHDNINDKSIHIEETYTKHDENFRIKSLLETLSARNKQIIFLKFYEGYTNIAIANKLKISETNVSSIIYRSLKKLKEEALHRSDINVY